ncbi:outer membrane lipoprotein [Klebsiella pneumoniae]|uniref:Outer membrane lipoprotein n=1 Tax=Klebsiella pneumoniae TaxID=573 RepID=A0A377XNH0_KLEPN|nr:outer membrane lipoprotein [Klebsiella pneumoniae]
MHSETHAVGSGDLSSLQASQDEFETMVRNLDVKSRLMDQYASWKGVRYRLGGSTRKGIDCSAFVQRTFREQFGLELPRSTSEQQETGKSISRAQLRTGDLVLFRAGSTRPPCRDLPRQQPVCSRLHQQRGDYLQHG